MKSISRQQIEEILTNLDLDWGVDEDASILIDILLEAFTLKEAATWLFFFDITLGETPLLLMINGGTRAVFVEARARVSQVASSS